MEEKLEITKERSKGNFSLLYQAAADSESIQMILNLYSNREQIDLITQMENSPLNRAISFPESFRIMLNALPPPTRLLFLSKRRRMALIDYDNFPEQNYYYPLLDHLQKKPDSLAIALSLLPEKIS